MAQKRMFSMQIVDTDAFLDMPPTSQLLYFHLAMRADDDGFVSNPKKVMRMVGSQEDDFKILIAKRFIIIFDSGVCVIKHWRIHNYIQSDRYHETQWKKEKGSITLKYNGSYTECIQNVSKVLPQVKTKIKIKNNIAKSGDFAHGGKQEEKCFNQEEYIKGMRSEKSPPHVRLIGWYFHHRESVFPDNKTIQAEIKRWAPDATFVAKYDNDQIQRALDLVQKKFPDDWKLSTIKKYISEV